MRVTFDLEVDALKITLKDVPIEESDEQCPGVILDYDKDGNIVGIEILNASQRLDNPQSCEYSILSKHQEFISSGQ